MKNMISITILRHLAFVVTIAFPCFSMASSPEIAGKVLFVIDGDTYQISHAGAPEGEPVRARHFDTPEKGDLAQCQAEREKAGQASAFVRRLLPRGAAVALSDLGRDRYGRLLATVTLADGTGIAHRLIGAGLARPYEGGRRRGWCALERAR